VAVADFADLVEVYPVATEKLHKADRQQFDTPAGLVDLVERIETGQPLDVDASALQSLPGEIVSWEFLIKGYNLIASSPVQPVGNCCDALRRVLDDGYLAWLGMDHPCGCIPQTVVGRKPFVVVETPMEQDVLRQGFHCLGGRPAQWRHAGVMQVNVPFCNRKLMAVTLPQRGCGGFFTSLVTHSYDYT